MKLVKVDKIERRRYMPTQKIVSLIEEFVKSDNKSMEVIFSSDEYVNAHSCYGVFYKAIKREGFAGVKVLTRNGRVYLTRVAPDE